MGGDASRSPRPSCTNAAEGAGGPTCLGQDDEVKALGRGLCPAVSHGTAPAMTGCEGAQRHAGLGARGWTGLRAGVLVKGVLLQDVGPRAVSDHPHTQPARGLRGPVPRVVTAVCPQGGSTAGTSHDSGVWGCPRSA